MHTLRLRTCLTTSRWTHLKAKHHLALEHQGCSNKRSVSNNRQRSCRLHLQRRIRACSFHSAQCFTTTSNTQKSFDIRRPSTFRSLTSDATSTEQPRSLHNAALSLTEIAQQYPKPRSLGEHVPLYFYQPECARIAVCQTLDMLDRQVTADTVCDSAPIAAGAESCLNIYRTTFKVDELDPIDIFSRGDSHTAAEEASWAQLFVKLLADGILQDALVESNFNMGEKSASEVLNYIAGVYDQSNKVLRTPPKLTLELKTSDQPPDECTEWLATLTVPGKPWAPILRTGSRWQTAEYLAMQRYEELLRRQQKRVRQGAQTNWPSLPIYHAQFVKPFIDFYCAYTNQILTIEHKEVRLPFGSQQLVVMLLDGKEIAQQRWPNKQIAKLRLRLSVAIDLIKSDPDIWVAFLEQHQGQMVGQLVDRRSVVQEITHVRPSTTDSTLPTTSSASDTVDVVNASEQAEADPTSATDVAATTNSDVAHASKDMTPLPLAMSASTKVLMQRVLVAAQKEDILAVEASLTPATAQREPLRRMLHDKKVHETNQTLREKIQDKKVAKSRQSLPIWSERKAIVNMINGNRYSVIVGGTGCGKSTQVPQLVLHSEMLAGRGLRCNILCTQPRRVAAMALAKRVADEHKEPLGQTVGYQVRFDAVLPRDGASITYLTTGLLLERLKVSAAQVFDTFSHIFLDEVHERGVDLDVLMLTLKRLCTERRAASKKVPKIILMSATLDLGLYSRYWSTSGNPCPSLMVPGKLFPVTRQYLAHFMGDTRENKTIFGSLRSQYRAEVAQAESYLSDELSLDEDSTDSEGTTAVDLTCVPQVPILLVLMTITKICKSSKDGAILVFLPGFEEMKSLHAILSTLQLPYGDPPEQSTPEVLLLHSSLTSEEQLLVFEPLKSSRRRIILSTNIAETSVTVPHVRFVIDTGIVRELQYDQTTGAESLENVWISKSSSTQRMGRAGRLEAGHYYALFSQARFNAMDKAHVPQILRSNLSKVALQLKAQFPKEQMATLFGEILQSPSPDSIDATRRDLQAIGALNDDESLTRLGLTLSQLFYYPRWGRVILLGVLFKCVEPLIIIATSTEYDLFMRPMLKRAQMYKQRQLFNKHQSDHLAVYNAYKTLLRMETDFGQASAKEFASEHLINWRTYVYMKKQSAAIVARLQRLGLLDEDASSGRLGGGRFNSNSDKHELIKCLLLNGFPAKIARWRGGHLWMLDEMPAIMHSSSLLLKPQAENGPALKLRLFTALSNAAARECLSMREVSSVSVLAGLLFCQRLVIRAGKMYINGLRPVRDLGNPSETAKLVLEYKKLLNRVINHALQELGTPNWTLDNALDDFLQVSADLIEMSDDTDTEREAVPAIPSTPSETVEVKAAP